VVLRETDAWKK